jgi:hypothetical protein
MASGRLNLARVSDQVELLQFRAAQKTKNTNPFYIHSSVAFLNPLETHEQPPSLIRLVSAGDIREITCKRLASGYARLDPRQSGYW